jgi:hypothetical protein
MAGAHRLLQVRTRVLNQQLRNDFERWHPQLRAAADQFGPLSLLRPFEMQADGSVRSPAPGQSRRKGSGSAILRMHNNCRSDRAGGPGHRCC